MDGLKRSLTDKVNLASKFNGNAGVAKTAMGLIDLTSLSGEEAELEIKTLCDAAREHGVASVCVHAKYIPFAKKQLEGTGINVATVINFPLGNQPSLRDEPATPESTQSDVRHAVAMGADQVDIVLPYQEFHQENLEYGRALVSACRAACPEDVKMKVILETASFDDAPSLDAACQLAIECGTDSLKTSTGKHPKGGADLEAAAVLLKAAHNARRTVGVKISGGVRTVDDSAQYIKLGTDICGRRYIQPDTFRFGASAPLVINLADTMSLNSPKRAENIEGAGLNGPSCDY